MDKIYTKTGDKGYTTNILNKKYSKADIEMELQGGVDEINANVGFLRSLISTLNKNAISDNHNNIDDTLKKIQYHLYLIGIEVSTEFTEDYVNEEEIKFLEDEIDNFVDQTEPMKSFIYYSGNDAAAFSHITRTLTRRVERIFVRALEGREYPKSYQYINRLSDFFFSLARYINQLDGIIDEPMMIK